MNPRNPPIFAEPLIKLVLTLVLLGNACAFSAQHPKEWAAMNASKADTLEWFQDAKFGMFIHWGLYAIPAGVWDGKKIHEMRKPHIAEWIQYGAEVPRETYAELAKGFNPILFDANAIARLARRAGMKYLVVTSKHHDGFAMYDSEVSAFDIVDATPFKRDIVQELYDACREVGLDFGVYYSHNIDWADGSDSRVSELREKGLLENGRHNTYGANTWDPSPNTFEEYLENKAYPQVKEIMRKFPGMKCLWYDMPARMDAEQSFHFYRIVYEIQPQIIINHRIGNGFGDYRIPGDNRIPKDLDSLSKPWETVGTFNNSWGFSGYDQDWKSPREILYWLIEIVSKGGNYMLNIGPTALGGVPVESVRNLETVGTWLGVNGQAVYGTRKWRITKEGPTRMDMAGTDHRHEHGFTDRFSPEDFWFTVKGNTLYAISLVAPGGPAHIKSLDTGVGTIQSVEILGLGEVSFRQSDSGLEVSLPESFKPELGYVIKVDLASGLNPP